MACLLLSASPAFAQECGTVPIAGQSVLRQLAAKFPDLLRSPDDDGRRAWIRKGAEQMAFSIAPSWGTKSAGGGRPPSKDALARVVNGTLCGWDIVNGATRELMFGHGEPIPDQQFIPVSPVNHLAGGTRTPPDEDPRIAELEARIAALEAAVEEARASTDRADQRVTELEVERDALKAERDTLRAERDEARRERDVLLARPEPSCEAKIPGWLRGVLRIGCRIVK